MAEIQDDDVKIQIEEGNPIPEALLTCTEFNSRKCFHISDVKCPITRAKLKEIYNLPDHIFDDDDTKIKRFEQYHQEQELIKQQKEEALVNQQNEINELKDYIKQQNDLLHQIVEKLKNT